MPLRLTDKTTMALSSRHFAQQSDEVILEIEHFASIHSFTLHDINRGATLMQVVERSPLRICLTWC